MLALFGVSIRGLLVMSTLVLSLSSAASADPASNLIARGEYLTHGAGQCEDCHGANLVGGPAPAGPPNVPWASNAPSLRGLTMFKTDDQAVAFLTTGALPNGKSALPPMPKYRFNTADATAIVAYLRSLK